MARNERILIVGRGGREAALYEKLRTSDLVERVFVVPGNKAIPREDRLSGDELDFRRLSYHASAERITLIVPGPDWPVARGIVDYFKEKVPTVGPSQLAALLEGSKAYAKLICTRYGIPTAEYRTAKDMERATEVIHRLGHPLVIKADGLRAGKGVHIPKDLEEALRFAKQEIELGGGVSPVIIERKLDGREVSVTALCDGRQAMLLELSRDYKRLRAGTDIMTGGMGAYSPVRDVSPEMLQDIEEKIIKKLLAAMQAEGTPYHGVLYAGIMLTKEGPQLLEVNCRFGDPEAQVLLARMKSDLLPYLKASTVFGGLSKMRPMSWIKGAAVCVCLASPDYPKRGHRTHSLVGVGPTLPIARERAYKLIRPLLHKSFVFRRDIAAGL